GVESAVGSALSRTGLCQAGRNILTGAASSAVEGGVSDGLSYLAGPGPHTVGGLASSVGGGAVGGGLTGGATAKITNEMQGLTGWACFTADTPVVMADGSTRPIARVEVGDRVLAHNPHTGADEAREVLDAPVHEDAVTWRVSTDDGGTVTTTPTHRFWVQGAGWTKAQDLVPGDRLRTTAGPSAPPSTTNPTENPHTNNESTNNDGATVVESQPTGQASTVHNLTIHGLTNYYITTTTGTRALVHNTYDQPRDPATGQFTKGAGGESAATEAGRRAHSAYPQEVQSQYPGNWRFDKGIPGMGGKYRPDAADYGAHVIRELKPNAESAISAGRRQLRNYIKVLNGATGGKPWEGHLDTYNPDGSINWG
ncbi:MAG: polymorphic toxin-type HINT domain-containing protein, partial [Actinomyces dentalis]